MRREIVARVDRQKAYEYFRRTQGWPPPMVDQQVLTPLDEHAILGTALDQTSVMSHQLPTSITKDARPILGGTDITATDRAFAARIYPRPAAKLSSEDRPGFYFVLEGEAARGRFVRYGTDVDLLFDYGVPSAGVAAVISASKLDSARASQSPLGILIAPVGLFSRGQDSSTYRQMHFNQDGTVTGEVRFYLRAIDEPMRFQLAKSGGVIDDVEAPQNTGIHVVFDVRGVELYQFFLPVQLVYELPELQGSLSEKPLAFDLDQLQQFETYAVEAQQKMATAVHEVLYPSGHEKNYEYEPTSR